MKVLLVYANTLDILAPPPVGLCLMTGPLRAAGHEVRVLDLMKEKDPDGLLRRTLEEDRFDLTGFSCRNLDNMDMLSNIDLVPSYERWVGIAAGHGPVIIGGSAVMAAPQALYERTGATWALAGQGNRAFPMFLEELAGGRSRDFTTPGLLWRQDGEIRHNPGLHDGYRDDGAIDWSVVDLPRYRKPFMNHCVVTKTGCPYRCLFCDANTTFGPEFVPREPDTIVEELRRDARHHGMHRKDWFLVDALLNQPVDWAKRLCEALIRFEHRVMFYAVLEPTSDLDQELARLLRRAGCLMVTSLLGSADDGMLQRLRRPFDLAAAHRAFGLLDKARVPYMLQYMWGGPGETRQTVEEGFRQSSRWRPVMNWASYGLRILPAAGLFEVARDEGIVDGTTDLLSPTFYLSEALRNDRPWLDAQVKRMNRPRPGALPQWAGIFARTFRARLQFD
ncbi:MAG: radical SAM protein [Deltaproteobacteria bacterium]|nr:radical SAM protein [Deltaproteobacteria bacterium]